MFGPHPRNHGYKLPKAILRAALRESLKGKLRDQELIVLDRLEALHPRTKLFAGLEKQFGVKHVSLIVLEAWSEPLVKSLRNLPSFTLQRASELNAWDVLNAEKVLLTHAAFVVLEGRLRALLNGHEH